MKYCEKCQEQREDEYQYCNKCGTPLVEREEPKMRPQAPTKGMVMCSNCGNTVDGNNRFCTVCGKPLEHATPPVQPVPVPPPPTPPVSMTPVTPPTPPTPRIEPTPPRRKPVVQPPVVQSPVDEPPYGGKKKLSAVAKTMIIFAAVIAAILLFAGSFLLTEYFVFDTTPAELFGLGSASRDRSEEEDFDTDDKENEDLDDPDSGRIADVAPAAIEEATLEAEEEAPYAVEEAAPTPEPTPEPTPTPYVWPDWYMDFNAEQAAVDDWVKTCRKTKSHYKKHDYGDVSCYINNDCPMIIDVKKDVNGWKYNREYVGIAIYYVEMDDGYQVVQRFYFAEGRLFRVIDEDGTVHDYGSSDWEEYNEIGERLIEERQSLVNELT